MLKGELEMYTSGVRPMKATGARWIDHKLWTMDNLIRNLDFIHLNNIISTTTVPILKKKQLKQRNSVYTQKSDINIINILHLVKFRKLSKNHDLVFQLPTWKLVIDAVESNDKDGDAQYQDQKINYYLC